MLFSPRIPGGSMHFLFHLLELIARDGERHHQILFRFQAPRFVFAAAIIHDDGRNNGHRGQSCSESQRDWLLQPRLRPLRHNSQRLKRSPQMRLHLRSAPTPSQQNPAARLPLQRFPQYFFQTLFTHKQASVMGSSPPLGISEMPLFSSLPRSKASERCRWLFTVLTGMLSASAISDG